MASPRYANLERGGAVPEGPIPGAGVIEPLFPHLKPVGRENAGVRRDSSRYTQAFETATGIRWIRDKSPERTDWIRPLASPGYQTIVFDPQKVTANS
jgi:hypothetical protein